MRSLKMATCTSGEPVSSFLVANSLMSVCFRSAVIDIQYSVSSQVKHAHRANFRADYPGQRHRLALGLGANDGALGDVFEG